MNIAKDFQTQQLLLLKANKIHIENLIKDKYELPVGYNLDNRYVILGEVETTNHYIMLNITTGKVLPGTFHLEDFEYVPEEDI